MDRLFLLRWWQIGRFGEKDADERIIQDEKFDRKQETRGADTKSSMYPREACDGSGSKVRKTAVEC